MSDVSEKPKRQILRLAKMPVAIYAIGDIHGCLDLYNALEAKIVADAQEIEGPKLIICLGDVVDRGAKSSEVLDRLRGPAPDGFQRLVLRGNHEDMMLAFLRSPQRHMNWLSFGGEDTLASYGVRPSSNNGFAAEGKLLKHKLRTLIPEEHYDFLDRMPLALEVGTLRFAHAGYALSKPAHKQSPDLLLWGPPIKADSHTGDEILVHGHVIVDDVELQKNRINLDVGAYKTGKLVAMRFDADCSVAKTLIVSQKSVTDDE